MRVRIQASVKPIRMAITVAITAMIDRVPHGLDVLLEDRDVVGEPNSTGGNAMGSPTFSDSSTRKTIGSRTRKPTISRTASVVRACPLMRPAQNATHAKRLAIVSNT